MNKYVEYKKRQQEEFSKLPMKAAFGEEKLKELLKALKGCQRKYPKWTLNEIISDGQPYPTFKVDEFAEVYVTYLQYDVYHLALKRFL